MKPKALDHEEIMEVAERWRALWEAGGETLESAMLIFTGREAHRANGGDGNHRLLTTIAGIMFAQTHSHSAISAVLDKHIVKKRAVSAELRLLFFSSTVWILGVVTWTFMFCDFSQYYYISVPIIKAAKVALLPPIFAVIVNLIRKRIYR